MKGVITEPHWSVRGVLEEVLGRTLAVPSTHLSRLLPRSHLALVVLGSCRSPGPRRHASSPPTPCPNFPVHPAGTWTPGSCTLTTISSPEACQQSCGPFPFFPPFFHSSPPRPITGPAPVHMLLAQPAASALSLHCRRLLKPTPCPPCIDTLPVRDTGWGRGLDSREPPVSSYCHRQSHCTCLEYLLSHVPKGHFTPPSLFSNSINAGKPTSVPLKLPQSKPLSFFIQTVEIVSNQTPCLPSYCNIT